MKILTVTALLFAIALPGSATITPAGYSYSTNLHVAPGFSQGTTYTTEFTDADNALVLNASQYQQDSLPLLESISLDSRQCWLNADYVCGVAPQDR